MTPQAERALLVILILALVMGVTGALLSSCARPQPPCSDCYLMVP